MSSANDAPPAETPPPAAPSPAAPPDPLDRLVPITTLLLGAVFVLFIGATAHNTVRDLLAWSSFAGEFSVGEAGKAFYAWRWKTGESMFLAANEPPHYPSFHGPAMQVVVGSVAWLLDLSRDQMLGAGRAVATVGLVTMAVLAMALARLLGARWLLVAGVPLLFMASTDVHAGSVSYRPDPWMGACGLATALVFLRARDRWWGFALLVVLPVLGYGFKALGVSAAMATVACFVLVGQWRRGLIYAAAFAASLFVAVGLVQWASGGLYLRSFAEAVVIERSLEYLLSILPRSTVTLPIAAALVLGAWGVVQTWRRGEVEPAGIVGVYLAVSLATALASSLRVGAHIHYYLEPFAFTSALVLWGLGRLPECRPTALRLGAMAAIILVLSWLWMPNLQRAFRGPWIGRTVPAAVEAERRQLISVSRDQGVAIFTNDPTLTLRLDRHGLFYVRFAGEMVASGALDPESYLGPLRDGQWPLVALLNDEMVRNSFVSMDQLSGFNGLLAERYERVKWIGPHYKVYRLKRPPAAPPADVEASAS